MPHAIPLTQPVSGMPAAIYIRVSTPRQKDEGYSLATQLPACLTYAQQYHFPVKEDHICIDDMTGTRPDRPGMEVLRDLVYQQAIKLVIVYKIDRFMRDFAYQLMMIKEFSRSGVQVIDTTSPPLAPTLERTLLQQLLGAIAQFEHGQILERTENGRRGRAHAGIPSARSALGYRYVTTGKKTGHYEIDPAEAALILQIYQWYASEGLTLHQIAVRLNREGVPTYSMRRSPDPALAPQRYWQPPSLQRVLTNRDYLGRAYYGKTMNVPSPVTPHKVTKRPTDEATWTPIVIPALVPQALFEAAQERRARNARENPRRRKRDYLLLGGRLRCEVCGHHMIGTLARDQRAYRCFRAYEGERKVSCRVLRAHRVEPQVWDFVCHLARHPDELTRVMHAYGETVGPAQVAQDRATLQRDLQKTARALARLLDLYVHRDDDDPEPMPKALYLTKKKALDQEAALYQAQLLALSAQEEALEAAASTRKDLEATLCVVNDLLDEATTIPAQQRILDMLGTIVYYTPAKQFRVDLAARKPLRDVSESFVCSHDETRHIPPGTVLLSWTLAA